MILSTQAPNLINNKCIVFIKDDAFNTLYDVFNRNFTSRNRKLREYSLIWFRQMWRKLNDLAGLPHVPTVSIEDI